MGKLEKQVVKVGKYKLTKVEIGKSEKDKIEAIKSREETKIAVYDGHFDSIFIGVAGPRKGEETYVLNTDHWQYLILKYKDIKDLFEVK